MPFLFKFLECPSFASSGILPCSIHNTTVLKRYSNGYTYVNFNFISSDPFNLLYLYTVLVLPDCLEPRWNRASQPYRRFFLTLLYLASWFHNKWGRTIYVVAVDRIENKHTLSSLAQSLKIILKSMINFYRDAWTMHLPQ
jgi:hypothetical protein